MYMTIEQPVYGFWFLFFYNHEKLTSKPWINILWWSVIAFLLTLILLLIANYVYPIVAWEPKALSPLFILVWTVHMLLSVFLPEEAFLGVIYKQV
jgi:hypothetical protein